MSVERVYGLLGGSMFGLASVAWVGAWTLSGDDDYVSLAILALYGALLALIGLFILTTSEHPR